MNKTVLITLILILGISGIIFAEDFSKEIVLEEGINQINLSYNFNPIYAKDLVTLYPDIQTITYVENGKEIGYVNVFGGIGENFIIYPNQIYEISVKKEVGFNLK